MNYKTIHPIAKAAATAARNWKTWGAFAARRYAIADRERGALRRLDTIMARYPELSAYVQTDPRGAALYIYRKGDEQQFTSIDCCYSSIGTAIYK